MPRKNVKLGTSVDLRVKKRLAPAKKIFNFCDPLKITGGKRLGNILLAIVYIYYIFFII